MRRKINKQLIGIAIAGIIATLLLTSAVFYDLFRKQVQEDLRINVAILKNVGLFLETNADAIDIPVEDLRITWISSEGKVLYDNGADVGNMDNHLDRPEVQEALKNGSGQAIRNSDTLNKNTYYYAVCLEDGSILRSAREAKNILSVYESALPVITVIVLVMIACCVFLARFLTKNLLRPMEEMAVNIDSYSEKPLYKELVPFMNTIRAQHEDILKAAKMRQDFTANVSHELKTPLTAVSGYAELMENGIVQGQEVQRFSGEIRKNANRLLSLINDIIRLSQLDSMEEENSFEIVDLYETAKGCTENLSISAQRHSVSLSLIGEKAAIRGNRELITELVINLCDNAIRYNNKDGWVKVTVRKEAQFVQLCVEDNGIGIPREHQDRVFERFYRVDKSRSKQTGGTGLGLAIVKHIVAIHDAELKLESEPGKGTRITVTFS